jgi:uncharacterized protein (TIGR00297 family)
MEISMWPWPRLLLGFGFSAIIAGLGYWKRALAPGGVLGALIIGTLTFGLGGWAWGVLVIAFFVSSSLLSYFRAGQKRHLAEKFSKGSRRDLGQALANGGVGALLALVYFFSPAPWLFAAFVGVMAAVNADTWATELGVLGRRQPRLLTTWKPVPIGTSGAVSAGGTLASLSGGLFIGLCAWALGAAGETGFGDLLRYLVAGGIGGTGGSLFDSLLGATLQAIYYCDTCRKETEQRQHRCGAETRQIRGWSWLDNDLVNLFSSVVGGLLAAGAFLLMG